jgi:glycosyltransferase involved in cell wall biosynthesis
VTIGICTRNNEETVRRTLESILRLDYDKDSLEVVIEDGSSRDRTLDIARSLLAHSNLKWKILSDPGRGLGYARRQLVEKASGEFIAFVDADHYLHPLWLKRIVQALLDHPNAAAVHSAQGLTFNLPVPAALENYIKFVQDQEIPLEAEVKDFGVGCSLIRKEAIIEAGGFDPSFSTSFNAEDADLAARLTEGDWKIINNKTSIFYHIPRKSWRALYEQYRGWGRGFCLATKKNSSFYKKKSFFDVMALLLVSLPQGVRYALKTFKVSRDLICLLMPIHYIFKLSAWSVGYLNVPK